MGVMMEEGVKRRVTYRSESGRKKIHFVPNYEDVKRDVEEHVRENGLASPYSLKDFTPNGLLYEDLRILALATYGAHSPGKILADMGFKLRRRQRTTQEL